MRPIGDTIEVPYDTLIVAAGVTQSYFGHDEFARYAPGMKTIDDALELRRRIFGAFEIAEIARDADEQREWLTIVVVGAGPTGVELAGQIRELATRSLRREFRRIDPAAIRVIVLDAGPKPLATFGDNLSKKAQRTLEHMGVELHMGARVTGVDAFGVDFTTDDGKDRIPTHTVVWAAGVQAAPIAAKLAAAAGAETDRAGRIKVLPDLTLPGHPEVFAVGDMTTLNNLPGVAEVAMQGSLHAANTIRRRLVGDDDGEAVRIPRLGQRRRDRPLPRDLQLASHSPLGIPGVGRVAVRAPRVLERLRESHRRAVPVGAIDDRFGADGARASAWRARVATSARRARRPTKRSRPTHATSGSRMKRQKDWDDRR